MQWRDRLRAALAGGSANYPYVVSAVCVDCQGVIAATEETAQSAQSTEGQNIRGAAANKRAADEANERAAIMAEPPLPPLGTAERKRLDDKHSAMVAGLLAAAAG